MLYKYHLGGSWYDTTREQLVGWLCSGALPAETWVLPPGASEPIVASELLRQAAAPPPPPPPTPRPAPDPKAFYCRNCGTVSLKTKTVTPGKLVIEIALWLVIFIPGLIYSCWRVANRKKGCLACGSTDLLPATSPVALAAMGEHRAWTPASPEPAPIPERKRSPRELPKHGLAKGLAALSIVTLGAVYAIVHSGPPASVEGESSRVAAPLPPPQKCLLHVSEGKVPLARTQVAYAQLVKSLAAEDWADVNRLMEDGDVFAAESGTPCSLVARGKELVQVRVDEGEWEGVVGYVLPGLVDGL